MTALFFISRDTGPGQRVDLASLAQLFAEPDEPTPPRADRRPIVRLALLALILLGTVGDMVFVARPGALCPAAGIERSSQAAGPSGPEQA